ncbi:MAG: HlyD family efflux transporter periplasmic adaptor subunit [Bacteroidales bacterium]|nr:HlyD family efflux transporter periplasmic adaptor subunit [Bacteroidales bacterium]
MQLPSDIENTIDVLNSRYRQRTNWIYILLVSAVIITVILLPIIKVDVSSQSRGIIRSKNDNLNIVPIVSGRVKFVNIVNNHPVNAGDTLLIIESDNMRVQLLAQTNLKSDLSDRIADLKALTSGAKNPILRTALYIQEQADYQERTEGVRIKAQQAERDYQRLKESFNSGLASKTDYEQAEDRWRNAKNTLETASQQQLASWQNTKKQLEQQLITCNGEIERLESELRNYIVTAPASGTIITQTQIQPNSYIAAGQNVASISPDESLIAECYVSPADIGFIAKNQEVKLSYDAFDYNQWGLGLAAVEDVDKNISIENTSSYFVVRCRLKGNTLSLKNGYTVEIKKGMTLTARFLITRRTLWQLLFDKADKWFNPKQIPQQR